MRRSEVAVVAALLILTTAVGTAVDARTSGGFGIPFREDRAAYTVPSAADPNGVLPYLLFVNRKAPGGRIPSVAAQVFVRG